MNVFIIALALLQSKFKTQNRKLPMHHPVHAQGLRFMTFEGQAHFELALYMRCITDVTWNNFLLQTIFRLLLTSFICIISDHLTFIRNKILRSPFGQYKTTKVALRLPVLLVIYYGR